MKNIDPKKQIEIALIAGMVARAALNIQGIQEEYLVRLSFECLVEEVERLGKAMPLKSNRQCGFRQVNSTVII